MVILLLCLSLLLGACVNSKAALDNYAAARASGEITEAEVPRVPARYKVCAKLASLPNPKGGWSRQSATKALATLRASEVEKHDCLLDLVDWSNAQLDGMRGTH